MGSMSNAIRAGKAFVEIFGDATGLNKAMDSVRDRARQLAGELKQVGATAAGIGTAIVAPIALAVNQAGSFAEDLSKFGVVFGDNAEEVRAWGDEYAKQVGRSRGLLTKMLAEAQDTLGPLAQMAGIDPANAQELSKTIATLAVDLASFNNMTDEEAFDSLIRGMVVSTTNLRKFGVVANEAAVKQRALEMGFDAENLTPYHKALAILNITQQATTSAQGDAIRTADSYANQMKALKASVADAAVEVGDIFLPMATRLIAQLKVGVGVVTDFAKENEVLAQAIGMIGASLLGGGMALVIGGQLASSIVAVTTALQAGGLAAAATAGGIATLSAAVGLYAIGVFDLIKQLRDLEEQQKRINQQWDDATEKLKTLTAAEREQVKESIALQSADLSARREALLEQVREERETVGGRAKRKFFRDTLGYEGTPDLFASEAEREMRQIDQTLDQLRRRAAALSETEESVQESTAGNLKERAAKAVEDAGAAVKESVSEMDRQIGEQVQMLNERFRNQLDVSEDFQVPREVSSRLRSATTTSASLSSSQFFKFKSTQDPAKKLVDVNERQLDVLRDIERQVGNDSFSV